MSGNKEKTLVIIKPDAIEKGAAPDIIKRLQMLGLRLAKCERRRLTSQEIHEHYRDHVDRPYFPSLRAFMMSGDVIIIIFSGDKVIQNVRDLIGPTDSRKAPEGTIRGDYGEDNQRNAIHASDSPESAAREIANLFPR